MTIADAEGRGSAMKVVFVDDDPDIREIVALALKVYSGIEVRAYGSVVQAIASAIAWKPDLVVTDLNMPGMDGSALLAALKSDSRTCQIPVVFLTAGSNPATCDSLLQAGARAILAKPFDPRSLGQELLGLIPRPGGSFDERLAGIRSRFRARAADEASALARDWTDGDDPALRLKRITDRAHALAGTAGMLGFADITAAARRLEKAMASGPGSETARSCVADLCQALQLVASGG